MDLSTIVMLATCQYKFQAEYRKSECQFCDNFLRPTGNEIDDLPVFVLFTHLSGIDCIDS